MNTDSKFTRQSRFITVSLFFLLLWVPIIQMIHPIIPEIKSTEKRTAAKMPKIEKFRAKALKRFIKQFDLYLGDHYGLRNMIVKAYCMIHVNLLRTSPTRDVVLGREGWLYYDRSTDGINLRDFCGDAPLSEHELEMIVEKIAKINRFCEDKGIIFKIVVAPNKHTIYPEFLPSEIKNRRGASTRLDQLKNVLVRNKLGSVLIDLRPTLLFSKGIKPYPLYYLTDTHWNQMGAFIAYTEIMKNLLPRFPEIKILDIKNYRIVIKENNGLGDLASFINMSGLLRDQEVILEPLELSRAKKTDLNIELEKAEMENLRYRIRDCNYPKLLMFRDSFSVGLVPYLSESFSDSFYLWTHTWTDSSFSLIEKEKPQIVIQELVERHLQSLSVPFPAAFEKTQGKS